MDGSQQASSARHRLIAPKPPSIQREDGGQSSVASSVLFQNDDKSIIIIDIPRSLEEAQCHTNAGDTPDAKRRIYSVQPVESPYETPEPPDGYSNYLSMSTTHQVADLMTSAAIEGALQDIEAARFEGSFCLPRMIAPDTAFESSGHFLPKDATYLHGSIQDKRDEFINEAPRFDLIVLDPPWPNRSARRSKSYSTVSNLQEMQQLLSLIPVPSKLTPDGLVAIWVTNAPSVHTLVRSSTGILASWGLEYVTQWIWVKVTSDGNPIYSIDSQWRKPWEQLLIAKRIGSKLPTSVPAKVIVAVPDLHSRKPNLRGLFEDMLGRQFTGLEVFARNLTTGWWSWGDEVLYFQNSQHWVPQAS